MINVIDNTSEEIRNVYIDCGSWTGDSILSFKKNVSNDFEIYAFECDPRLIDGLETLSNRLGFKFIDRAVWIEDTIINLYPGINNLTQSSSLNISKKKLIDKKHPVVVNTIDLSKWILDNFNINDYIICKMNIEGAEYDVLEKMISDGSIFYINKLYVAWHYKKLDDCYDKRHNKLKSLLGDMTDLLDWNFESEKMNPF